MKRISSICFLLVTLLLAACGEKPKPIQMQLTLSADKLSIIADGQDKATLSVRDQVNQDYTGKAVYMVNGKKIDKAEFSTKTPGEYKVVATVSGVTSNEITIVAKAKDAKIEAIVLKVDKTNVLADGTDKIVLSCYDAANLTGDPLKEVTFFANGEKLSGNTFSTKEAGAYKLKAQYEKLESPEVEVTATKDEPNKDFNPTAHVLLEDWTGTWCPYCPRAHTVLEDADKDPKFVTLEIHRRDNWDVGAMLSGLFTTQSIGGYPTIKMNRTYVGGTTFEGIKSMFANITTEVGIALDVKLEQGKVVANTKVRRKPSYTQDVRIAVTLYENDLHADQANAVYPEKGNPIKNQKFDHVLRDFYNSAALGFAVEFNKHVHTGQYDFTPKGGWNTTNLGVIVMALDKKDRVINSQYANIGESKGY